jgi:uncharacterized protein
MKTLSRSFVCFALAPALGAEPAVPTPWQLKPAVESAQQLFSQGAVTLLDGPFKSMQDADHAYLIRLEPDRLLAQFRVEAGLEPKAKPYGGWESPAAPGTIRSLAGHSLGHYLSAISLMYQITGDHRLLDRVSYISKEWKECQDKRGDGSLVAFPFARELENDIRAGKVETIDNYWAPFYTIHKQLAGLRDAWVLCGDTTAREVLVRCADWCGSHGQGPARRQTANGCSAANTAAWPKCWRMSMPSPANSASSTTPASIPTANCSTRRKARTT